MNHILIYKPGHDMNMPTPFAQLMSDEQILASIDVLELSMEEHKDEMTSAGYRGVSTLHNLLKQFETAEEKGS